MTQQPYEEAGEIDEETRPNKPEELTIQTQVNQNLPQNSKSNTSSLLRYKVRKRRKRGKD